MTAVFRPTRSEILPTPTAPTAIPKNASEPTVPASPELRSQCFMSVLCTVP